MSLDLNWSAAWDVLRAKLSGYQLLGEQRSRFHWKERSYLQRARIPIIILGSFFTLLVLLWLFSGRGSSDGANHVGSYVRYQLGQHWHGWSKVQQAIVFGDSWSTTCFRPLGPVPSADSPMGMPEWPGETVGNGPNWVGYLTYQLNESLVLTADFAIGGAPVADLVQADERSLRSQVVRDFPAFNVNHTNFWTADSSLFFIWIGINDIHNAENTTAPFPETFRILSELVDLMYSVGARNFMVINVPPLGRAPIATEHGLNDTWKAMVKQWNSDLAQVAWSFVDEHPDVTLFYFDAWQYLNDIMDNPCSTPESCGFKVTEGYCPYYSMGNVEWNTFDPRCEYSADKYFWSDPLHPTTVLHNATAHGIYRALKSSER